MNYRTMEIYKRIKELYDNARMNDSGFITQNYEWIIGRQVVDLMTDELRDYLIVDKDLPCNDNTLMGIRVTIDYNHTCRIGLYKDANKLNDLKKLEEEKRKAVYITTASRPNDDWLTKALKDELNMKFGMQPGRGGFTYFKPKFPIVYAEPEERIKVEFKPSPAILNYIQNDILAVQELYNRRRKERAVPEIDHVIYNNPATIVFWKDGTKTVVKAQDEAFDEEKGLAMAIAKKVYGNNGRYFDKLKKHLPKIEKKPAKKPKARKKSNKK